MKEFISSVKRDKITFNIFIASLGICLVTIALILLNYLSLPPYVPVFNQMPWGNDRLVQTPGVFIPTVIFLIVFVFNFGFASFLYTKNNPLLARIVASVTVTASIMNFIFIIKLLLLIL